MMTDYTKALQDEISEFERQRERVRAVIGQLGGKPTRVKKVLNVMFIFLVIACFALSFVVKGRMEIFMLEIGVLLVSAKLIYFLFLQAKVIHFQFWILSSIEWRVNEISGKLDRLSKTDKNEV